ncbi:MAG: NAD-dependent deacylase [bacterium]
MFSGEFINRIKNSKKIAVLTGAGISRESGVPTFRDPDGFWAKYNPQELASMHGFMSNPKLVLEWYQMRRHTVNRVEPNPGHFALAVIEQKVPYFTLITQNVDDLHRRAGSKNIIELHGNILNDRCNDCYKKYEVMDVEKLDRIPRECECGGIIRPDVVWFGESLSESNLERAFYEARECDVFMSIGTSAEVMPAAQLPYIAKANNSYFVEINYEPTPISDLADETVHGRSGEILPGLLKELRLE